MRGLLDFLHRATSFQLPQRIRERQIVRRLYASGMVDFSYYFSRYPDLDENSIDPVVHYVRHGAGEGRNPNDHFDSAYYLEKNPDVTLPRHNPLDHFHTYGWREGRNPHPCFDVDYYLAANQDVRESGSDPLQHYLCWGRTEGRPTLSPARAAEMGVAFPPKISIRGIHRPTSADSNRRADVDDPVILCVAHVVPYPPRAGNHLRIYRYLQWLERMGYQVIMISSPLPGEELREAELEEATCGLTNLIYCHRDGELRVALAPHLRSLIENLEGQVALPHPEAVGPGDELSTTEAMFCPDVAVRTVLHIDAKLDGRSALISHYVFSTRFMSGLRPETLKIIDTIDVFSTKQQKVAAFGIAGEMILSDGEESRLLRRGDVVMAIQAEEARELQNLVPNRHVITAGIDFDVASEESIALPRPGTAPTILLIASANAMNRQGLRDFLQYAWPLLRRDHPDATLVVAGAVSSSVPPECPGVRVLGFVDTLDDLYRSCHVVINPVVAGTGLKIKTVEALAAHRPIVTWPLGVDGMAPELRRLCFVVSDWYEFYLHLSSCLRSEKREAHSRQDRDQIAVALSAAHNYKLLGEAIDQHCRNHEHPRGTTRRAGASIAQTRALA